MRRPLPTFRDVVERLSARQGDAGSRPLIGSLSPLDYRLPTQSRESWAILHSVTEVGLKLIHPHVLRCDHVLVSLAGPDGEKLQAVMHRVQTESVGDLHETTAEFLRVPVSASKSLAALDGADPASTEPRWSEPVERENSADDETHFCADDSDQTSPG